jgi:hypothetical protein
MFESMTKLLEVIANYPGWVKYTIVGLISVILLLLIAFRPKAPTVIASEWKVRVYNFDNWGTSVRERHVGERFSGLILDHLLKLDLQAKTAPEPPPDPVGFVGYRGPAPTRIGDEFKDLAPFITVTGYVEDVEESAFRTHVRVSAIDSHLRIETLMVEVFLVEGDEKSTTAEARNIAGAIHSVIRTATAARNERRDGT